MRRFVCALTLLAVTSPAWAAKVEADPSNEYVITPDAGQWLVLAGSYRGPDAKNLAHQLVLQMRSRDNLPAYVFNFSEEKKRQQQEYVDALHQRAPDAPARLIHIEDEYGVLVGGYKDSEAAHDAMIKIKKLDLPKLELPGGKPAYDRTYVYDKKTQKVEEQKVNPLAKAFVTRNPTIPVQKRDPNAFDPLWKELNANETYSLLENKHAWTLVVKDFEGVSVIQTRTESSPSSFLKALGMGDKGGEVLNAAALNAHNLAEALRGIKNMKLDAYVLHTRHGSLVTVGGFDSLEDDQLKQLQIVLSNTHLPVDRDPKNPLTSGAKPQDLAQLQLMAKPMLMKVPRPDN
ncbi:MAG TPA: hypothetical protein VGG61_11740 [Gemmataceae bacterium]|jgi:hypothetical protein